LHAQADGNAPLPRTDHQEAERLVAIAEAIVSGNEHVGLAVNLPNEGKIPNLPPGPLLAVLREELELTSDLDLLDVVLNRWRGSRRRVAALPQPFTNGLAAQNQAHTLINKSRHASTPADRVQGGQRHLGFSGVWLLRGLGPFSHAADPDRSNLQTL